MAGPAQTKQPDFVPALGKSWLTGLYDPVLALTMRERRFKKRLVRQASLEAGMDVLDLACGSGTLAIAARNAQPKINVTGIDADPEMLLRAREKASKASVGLQLDQGMSFELPYPDKSFDRVLSSLFFHHLTREDKLRTVREVLRVLRPGGQLHVADWGRPATALMRGLFYGVQMLDGFETTRDNVSGALPGLFREAGFAEVCDRGLLPTVYGTLAFWQTLRA